MSESTTKRVLVAEDNRINQMIVVRLLAALGYQADVAENGLEALKLLQNGVYSAVLMDVQMPVMDGLSATFAIRALPGDIRRIPIIAVTANATASARQKCMAAGMSDFMTKPIDRTGFALMLERWTSGGDWQDQLLSA